jgi:hypothetical protein
LKDHVGTQNRNRGSRTSVGRVSLPDTFMFCGSGLYPRCCFACSCQRNRPYKGLPQIDYGFFLCGSGLHPRYPYSLKLITQSPLQRAPTLAYDYFVLMFCGSGLYPRYPYSLKLITQSPLQRAPTVEYGHFSVGADCIRDGVSPAAAKGIALTKGSHR